MRCTTELTARFALTSHLIGTSEIEDFFTSERFVYDERSDSLVCVTASGAMLDAIEQEELRQIDLLADRTDALDFDTVPFESVEEDLSVELFEQDAAEDRAWDYDSWDEEPSDEEYERICAEMNRKASMRRRKLTTALERATAFAPHLNWAPLVERHAKGWSII